MLSILIFLYSPSNIQTVSLILFILHNKAIPSCWTAQVLLYLPHGTHGWWRKYRHFYFFNRYLYINLCNVYFSCISRIYVYIYIYIRIKLKNKSMNCNISLSLIFLEINYLISKLFNECHTFLEKGTSKKKKY